MQKVEQNYVDQELECLKKTAIASDKVLKVVREMGRFVVSETRTNVPVSLQSVDIERYLLMHSLTNFAERS